MDDLDVTCWVDARGPFVTVWNIETTRHHFDHCPICKHPLKHGFIFYTDDQRIAQQENRVVMNYSKTGAIWKGNILVLKDDSEDGVENIEVEDFKLVTSLLQQSVRHRITTVSHYSLRKQCSRRTDT